MIVLVWSRLVVRDVLSLATCASVCVSVCAGSSVCVCVQVVNVLSGEYGGTFVGSFEVEQAGAGRGTAVQPSQGSTSQGRASRTEPEPEPDPTNYIRFTSDSLTINNH